MMMDVDGEDPPRRVKVRLPAALIDNNAKTSNFCAQKVATGVLCSDNACVNKDAVPHIATTPRWSMRSD